MWLFGRKGSSGFSYYSTAEEVTVGVDGSGLTAVVTGGTSGIGAETTRVLALRGVHVIMAVWNVAAGKEVREAILEEVPKAKVDVSQLDLSSMASVRKFASDFISSDLPLNLLINNAGVGTFFQLSKDNIELHFATNYLRHFLLTNLLLDTIKKTSRETKRKGRVMNVSSYAYKFTYPGGIRFDQINDEAGYNSARSYGQSKLANILHTNELARHLKDEEEDITANSLHPGMIPTNLNGHDSIFASVVNRLGKYVMKNVQQGAATTCYVALHPQVQGTSGGFFVDCNLGKASGHASDVALAKKLWDFSLNLINLKLATPTTIETKVPLIVDGVVMLLDGAFDGPYTWGTDVKGSQTMGVSEYITIPANSAVMVRVIGTQGKCDVSYLLVGCTYFARGNKFIPHVV